MSDVKPPRLVAGERETLLALLQYQRDSFVRKVTGVDEEDARRTFVGSGTNLLWLTKHMAHAESLWVIHRFAGRDLELHVETVHPDDTIASVIDALLTLTCPSSLSRPTPSFGLPISEG
jgi:Protein of unknown function (DUF664)